MSVTPSLPKLPVSAPAPIHSQARVEAVVDLDVIAANAAALRSAIGPATGLLAVVKADGYGHGMVGAARAALAGGATWLGVATADEALELRSAGIGAPALCWLSVPGEDARPLVDAGIDIGVSSRWRLDEVLAGARAAGRPARVQLKVDTGLSRNGLPPDELPGMAAAIRAGVDAGLVAFTGLWSHLAWGEEPTHPDNDDQLAALDRATGVLVDAGVAVPLRHLANSAAALSRPDLRLDLVRCGIALFGYPPVRTTVPLRPAMTLRSRLASVKPVTAGSGVSYGHRWHAPADTVVGLVPVGYGDGILRTASTSPGPTPAVSVAGRRVEVVGRICMDQFVVDLGPNADDRPGDEVVVFGPDGAPTAEDWATAAQTISYEVVTALHGRVSRRQVSRAGGRA